MRQYAPTDELINNLPYILMVAIGAGVFFMGLRETAWGWATGGGYLIYGVAGALWVIIFICPFCRYWGTRSCSCGYGRVSAGLRARRTDDRLAWKSKRLVPVLVPLWFLPLVAGVPILIRSFSWGFLVLLITFAVNSFGVLPVMMRQHGCGECMQKEGCPWTKRPMCRPE